MRAMYGTSRVRIISALRNPVDRLEVSFWGHRHYPSHYGASPEGLHKYAEEQTGAFSECSRRHDARRTCRWTPTQAGVNAYACAIH